MGSQKNFDGPTPPNQTPDAAFKVEKEVVDHPQPKQESDTNPGRAISREEHEKEFAEMIQGFIDNLVKAGESLRQIPSIEDIFRQERDRFEKMKKGIFDESEPVSEKYSAELEPVWQLFDNSIDQLTDEQKQKVCGILKRTLDEVKTQVRTTDLSEWPRFFQDLRTQGLKPSIIPFRDGPLRAFMNITQIPDFKKTQEEIAEKVEQEKIPQLPNDPVFKIKPLASEAFRLVEQTVIKIRKNYTEPLTRRIPVNENSAPNENKELLATLRQVKENVREILPFVNGLSYSPAKSDCLERLKKIEQLIGEVEPGR